MGSVGGMHSTPEALTRSYSYNSDGQLVLFTVNNLTIYRASIPMFVFSAMIELNHVG